jgi:tetratricopeptide (TPR) repeat protein
VTALPAVRAALQAPFRVETTPRRVVKKSIAPLYAMYAKLPRIGLTLASLAALSLAVGVGIVAARSWSPARRAARQAQDALAAARYEEASRSLARWLQISPGAAEAHVLMGRVATALGRLPQAAEELKKAQSLGGDRGALALLRAMIASKAGRHAEAVPTLKRAFDSGAVPDRQLDEALAKSLLETYDLVAAATVLEHWARAFPDDAKPHLWSAEIHRRIAGNAEAVEHDYREALRRDPSLAAAHLGLAEELRRLHRNTEAQREYEVYLAGAPHDATAHLGSGRNLIAQGNERDGLRHLQRASDLDGGNDEVQKELAEAAARAGDWPTALARLDAALSQNPCDLTLRYRRGLALARLGRAREARVEQAAAARLRVDLERLSEARRRVIAAPQDRKSQLEIAAWMFDHSQEREGARWAQKILGQWPGDPDASRLLAQYHQRRGEPALANFYALNVPRAQSAPSGNAPPTMPPPAKGASPATEQAPGVQAP